MMEPSRDDAEPRSHDRRPRYEPPRITEMSEDELLAAFQVTQASITWWVM